MKTVLTYGTFDLLHYGHIELLRRAKELSDGGKLIVGVSTDKINAFKHKKAYHTYEKRVELVSSIKYVDEIIAEDDWDQKKDDVKKYAVDIFTIADDWKGKFDYLSEHCQVIYLPRTRAISSSSIRKIVSELEEIEGRVG